MDRIEKLVLDMHEDGASVKEIARKHQISEYKVCKILCNAGIPISTRAAEVMRLLQAGKTQDEIAQMLEISRNAVQKYMPYTRGMKLKDNPTENAIRIRECRKRKKELQK